MCRKKGAILIEKKNFNKFQLYNMKIPRFPMINKKRIGKKLLIFTFSHSLV